MIPNVHSIPNARPSLLGTRPHCLFFVTRFALITLSLLLFAAAPCFAQDPAPSPSPSATPVPKSAEELKLEEENKILTLKKAQADLKKGIRDAQPAPSATPLEGKATLDENVSIEAEMITYNAMSGAIELISAEIQQRYPKANTIAIYNQKDVSDWRYYKYIYPAFIAQINNLQASYRDALYKDKRERGGPIGINEAFQAGSTVLRSFVDLVSMFRTDTEIKGKAVIIDDATVAAEMFRALKNQYKGKINLYNPAVFPVQPIDEASDTTLKEFFKSPTLIAIGVLYKKNEEADAGLRKLNRLKDSLELLQKIKEDLKVQQTAGNTQAAQSDIDKITNLEVRIGRVQSQLKEMPELNDLNDLTFVSDKIADLTVLNDRFTKFVSGFVRIDDTTGLNPLTLFIKSENLDKVVNDDNSYWLVIKSVKAGGNNRTQRSLIRYFTGAKISHSGGVVVSYTLYNRTGGVEYSDDKSVYRGYVDASKIKAIKSDVP